MMKSTFRWLIVFLLLGIGVGLFMKSRPSSTEESLPIAIPGQSEPDVGTEVVKMAAEVELLRSESKKAHELRDDVSQVRRQVESTEASGQKSDSELALELATEPAPSLVTQEIKPGISEEAVEVHLPKEKWTEAGWKTPQAAVQSFCAMVRQNLFTVDHLAPNNPDGYRQMITVANQVIGMPEPHDARIISKRTISDHEVEMKVAFNQKKIVVMSFQRIGVEWKMGPIRDSEK